MLPWKPMLVALLSFRADFTAAIRSPRLVVIVMIQVLSVIYAQNEADHKKYSQIRSNRKTWWLSLIHI